MAAKKKVMNTQTENDEVMDTMKARYFTLLRTEKMPNTPEITERIDQLETAINDRKAGKL